MFRSTKTMASDYTKVNLERPSGVKVYMQRCADTVQRKRVSLLLALASFSRIEKIWYEAIK